MSPPGLLMYRLMSRSALSYCRNSSWEQIRLATVSSIGVPRMMMCSLRSRVYTSTYVLLPRLSVSSTAGFGM